MLPGCAEDDHPSEMLHLRQGNWEQVGVLPLAPTGRLHRRVIKIMEISILLLSEALDALGLRRYCCRRMLLTHVDLIEKLLHFNSKLLDVVLL